MSDYYSIVSEDGVGRIEGDLASTDGYSILRTLIWFPPADAGEIRGVVQVVHGMAEHVERYENFAIALAREGYVVGGADHIGHGKSVSDESQLGHLPLKGGDDIMVTDAYNFSLVLRGAFPGVPFFLFGHSMGSFIVRRMAEEHSAGMAGVIVCGTGNQPVGASLAGNVASRLIARQTNPTYRSKALDNMVMGSMSKAIKNARTDYDWLSTDPEVVDAYIADPLAGQMFSVGGYASLTNLTAEVCTKLHARHIPADLPMLFIAGDADPVGDCGKGVIDAVKMYRKAGVREVGMILYPGMRHEILNEIGKEKVYVDVLNWMEDHR